MPKSILFITDPYKTLDHQNDTSLRLIEEFKNEGAKVYWSTLSQIQLNCGQLQIDALEYFNKKNAPHAWQQGEWRRYSAKDFFQIHFRVDPPINESYISALQLLHGHSLKKAVINSPEFILMNSEKTAADTLGLGTLTPKTWIVYEASQLQSILKNQKQVVLKPLYSAQSKGVALVQGSHFSKTYHQLSKNQTLPVLAQEYLHSVKSRGETRLWFVDGQLLGWCQKLPKKGQFKIDMDHGGTLAAVKLSTEQKSVSKKIGRSLKKYKIRLAAVDVIQSSRGSLITDLNFTSPGLLKQIEFLMGVNLAKIIAQKLLR